MCHDRLFGRPGTPTSRLLATARLALQREDLPAPTTLLTMPFLRWITTEKDSSRHDGWKDSPSAPSYNRISEEGADTRQPQNQLLGVDGQIYGDNAGWCAPECRELYHVLPTVDEQLMTVLQAVNDLLQHPSHEIGGGFTGRIETQCTEAALIGPNLCLLNANQTIHMETTFRRKNGIDSSSPNV
ncbi:hypothetical protein BLNAU_5302 [Blattamonas nauphoetae]|uniref:Uncharacterized protein n=1 Tax=Blattamonas nauphoetae TaxID=2049346 RepID=A0ABQ9Y7Z0_9EUKA|nr:hypothetical protein BLNAU_5302 [Blattamonas nauphoetae]